MSEYVVVFLDEEVELQVIFKKKLDYNYVDHKRIGMQTHAELART